jgi:hypothetical protein
VFAGSITGALCTNPGNAIATPQQLSLTVFGTGTNATVAPVMVMTMTAASVKGGLGLGVSATSCSALLRFRIGPMGPMPDGTDQ